MEQNVSDFLKAIPIIFLAASAFVGILKLIFRRSIVFRVTAIVTIPIAVAAIAGMGMGAFGIKHLIWIFPIVVVLFIGIFYWLASIVLNPLNKVTSNIKTLAKGDISVEIEEKDTKGSDEFAEEFRSMKAFIDGLKKMATFASQIGEGKLDSNYDFLSDKDILGKSLVEMQNNLQTAAKEQGNHKRQEGERNWVSQGLANFGDILRKNNDKIETLSYEIISSLVKYLEANQGGIFIINNNDPENILLELKACYAFDRKKYLEKEVHPGEGLVGTCWAEKESIYMTELPDSYINIRSGLGGGNPRSLLIVPLKINDEIYGVVELASFRQFMPFQIQFVEQLAESIASTVASVKIAEHTRKLLDQTQTQAQEMSEQEEELRQNMEELQATQEEAARRDTESQIFLKAVYSGAYIAEFDTDRKIIAINDLFIDLIKLPREKILGSPFDHFVKSTHNQNGVSYEEMWAGLLKGKPATSLDHVSFPNGSVLVLREHYAPIPDIFGEVYKIMVFSTIEKSLETE